MNGRYQHHRHICERIFIEGDLVLDSPTHLGNGDSDGFVDMPLLLDSVERKPLLTGASIAGALRSYLREVELGYQAKETPKAPCLAEQLFGCIAEEEEEEARLSWLMIDDSIAAMPPRTETRDGVSIDPVTRAARDQEKYDIELLPAGTVFPLSFEMLVPTGLQGNALTEGLAVALRGLAMGEIGLGQRKRRGYGACHVQNWRVRRFPVTTREGLLDWLKDTGTAQTGRSITELLLPNRSITLPDRRQSLSLSAEFEIVDTLIIRSASGSPRAPDAVHLRNAAGAPVIPGTTLAGVLRHQATRILNTISPAQTETFITQLFGPRLQGKQIRQPWGSRVSVRESVIENPRELVHTRVMIDRFTGGALPQHLFTEQPLTAGRIMLDCTVRNPTRQEVGLFALLLKDLWTGMLAIGGESSVGRGRLRGVRATLTWNGKAWHFEAQQGEVVVTGSGDVETLNYCVRAITEL